MTADDTLQIWIEVTWTGGGVFEMGRLTLIMEATDESAAAPAGAVQDTTNRRLAISPTGDR